jgi:hypothetical protein
MNTNNTKSSKYSVEKIVNIQLYDIWNSLPKLKVGIFGLCEIKGSTTQYYRGNKYTLYFVERIHTSNLMKSAIKFAKLYKKIRQKRMIEHTFHPKNIDFNRFVDSERMQFI